MTPPSWRARATAFVEISEPGRDAAAKFCAAHTWAAGPRQAHIPRPAAGTWTRPQIRELFRWVAVAFKLMAIPARKTCRCNDLNVVIRWLASAHARRAVPA